MSSVHHSGVGKLAAAGGSLTPIASSVKGILIQSLSATSPCATHARSCSPCSLEDAGEPAFAELFRFSKRRKRGRALTDDFNDRFFVVIGLLAAPLLLLAAVFE